MTSIVKSMLNYVFLKISCAQLPVDSDKETIYSSSDDDDEEISVNVLHSNGDVAPVHSESNPVDLFSLNLQVDSDKEAIYPSSDDDDEEISVNVLHSNGDVAPVHSESNPVDLFSLNLQVYTSLGLQQQQNEQNEQTAKLVSLLHAYMKLSDTTAPTAPHDPTAEPHHPIIPDNIPSFDDEVDDNVVVLPSPQNLRSKKSNKFFLGPRNPRKYFWSRFSFMGTPAAKKTQPPTEPVETELKQQYILEVDDDGCEFVYV